MFAYIVLTVLAIRRNARDSAVSATRLQDLAVGTPRMDSGSKTAMPQIVVTSPPTSGDAEPASLQREYARRNSDDGALETADRQDGSTPVV